MSGADKDTREQTSSLPYNNHHLEPMEQGSDPDRFTGSGASVTPISVGSRLLNSPTVPITRYRECLKNYAANTGGNVTDGCCEFMPSGNDGTLEAFICAACNCHRNFHRKETATVIATAGHHFLQLPPTLPPSASPSFNYHRHHHHHHHHQPNWSSSVNAPAGGSIDPPLNASPVKIALGGTESSSEELQFTVGAHASYGAAKKRFRSKFTQDQKEKMLEFAEKVGWRIPREDDPEVQRFCEVVGVKRQVLKVWMHNNKAISGKKHNVQDSNETIE